jgi:hypothetical protein
VVGEGLLEQTLTAFRSCGAGRRECVVFWAGSIDRPGEVDLALHPDHTSARGGYEVSATWLAETWNHLADERRSIRLQAHTHPRAAFHSPTDGAHPIVTTPGFLSLVLPHFGLPPQTLEDAFLGRLERDGSFVEVKIAETLVIGGPA